MSEEYEKYASIRWPEPVTLKTAAVRPKEYVVVLDLLENGLGVKLLEGKSVLLSYFKDCDLSQLSKEIHAFRKCFETVELADFDPKTGAALYKKLLEPALEKVPDGVPLTIIPDGELALLPFNALIAGGTATWKSGDYGDYPEGLVYLADRNPVLYHYSMTAKTLARRLKSENRHTRSLLVVADPVFGFDDPRSTAVDNVEEKQTKKKSVITLMDAPEEDASQTLSFPRLERTGELAKDLKALFGDDSRVFTGMAATKDKFETAVEQDPDRYRWIVFATHASAGDNLPGIMEPCLILTRVPEGTDGYLRMNEVCAMKTDADLVALTACQTGKGEYLAGEGILSLGRAFQCAGVKSALVSLWSVSESSSVTLVKEFFRFLKKGSPPFQAWQQARKKLQDEGFRHPFFWASFILVGEVH